MRALLFSIAMLAFLAVGCEEASNVKTVEGTPVGGSRGGAMPAADDHAVAEGGIELDEVDAAGLEAALAANSVTLIDFTAVW